MASCNAVAIAEATILTTGVAARCSVSDSAGLGSVVGRSLRTLVVRTAASNDCNHRFLFLGYKSHNGSNLAHSSITACRAVLAIEITALNNGFRQSTATGDSASAAICTRQTSLNLVDARVLFYLEFLGNKEQYYC
jgi:hypothetical protein